MPEPWQPRYSVAVDIGGTFTDLVAYNQRTGLVTQAKQLTTPAEFSQGVWDCLTKAQIASGNAETLVHGSTVAINIAIEKTGADTALVVTKGTRDVYKIGRQNRPEAYNFMFHRPEPLVPRSRTFEAEERMLATGEVYIALSDTEINRIVQAVGMSGVKAVAVCFLHSYANPSHEIRMADRLRQVLGPDVYVTASNEIIREYREYERISTTVMNAYIGPKTSAYVGRMERRLREEGFAGRFLIMQSNGGVMSPATAKSLPVAMMESGPVGGVIAAAEIGRRLGIADVISFDMGGTTAKTSLIKDGELSVAQGYYVGGYAAGHPVTFPVVDIIEVGAGGGSIAWIDPIGAMKLGPHSASSMPGPICYGRGGTEPTVTDANVVLGRIGAKSFLGGEMPLDADAARALMVDRLGDRLHMSATEIAHGIIEIAIAKMSLAVRGVSVECGYDPRDFALLASGGGGPPHAVAIARNLHIPKVIIPNLPAHFSALGMLMADVRHDYVRTIYRTLADTNLPALIEVYGELGLLGRKSLEEAGVRRETHSEGWWMDLRYVGQEFWLQIPVLRPEVEQADAAAIIARFHETHNRRFGHAAPDEPLELVNLRLTALGERPKIQFPAVSTDGSDPRLDPRPIYFDNPRQPISCPVYRRERLKPGIAVLGPCVIEEYGSTTILFEGDSLEVAETGEMIVSLGRR